MSIFCSSLPYTWKLNSHSKIVDPGRHLDRSHEDAVVRRHDGAGARTAAAEQDQGQTKQSQLINQETNCMHCIVKLRST